MIYIAITLLTLLLLSNIQHGSQSRYGSGDFDRFYFNFGDFYFSGSFCFMEIPPSVIREKHRDKPLPYGKTPKPEDDELA